MWVKCYFHFTGYQISLRIAERDSNKKGSNAQKCFPFQYHNRISRKLENGPAHTKRPDSILLAYKNKHHLVTQTPLKISAVTLLKSISKRWMQLVEDGCLTKLFFSVWPMVLDQDRDLESYTLDGNPGLEYKLAKVFLSQIATGVHSHDPSIRSHRGT